MFNTMYETLIVERIVKLPDFQKKEVLDFVDFLMLKTLNDKMPDNSEISFEWEGALKNEYKDITSVELQHNIWEV